MPETQDENKLSELKSKSIVRGIEEKDKISSSPTSSPSSNAHLFTRHETDVEDAKTAESELKLFRTERKRTIIFETIDTLLEVVVVLIIFISFQFFVVSPFVVDGSSMMNTLHHKELILVDRFHYGNHGGPIIKEPERGDVVVFHPPGNRNASTYFIKRIIGIPGDTVSFKDGNVYLNENLIKEPYTACRGASEQDPQDIQRSPCSRYTEMDGQKPFTVPPGKYFVMGDNRDASTDSRRCFAEGSLRDCQDGKGEHFVPLENIIGKAWFVFWPLNKLSANKSSSTFLEKVWPVDNLRNIESARISS